MTEDVNRTPAHDWSFLDHQFELLPDERDYRPGIYPNIEAYDLISGRIPGEVIDEAVVNDGKLYPVYVLVMHSGSGISRVVKAFTHDKFTHSVISFDPSMHKMYSFGQKLDAGKPIGTFICDDIRHEFFRNKEIEYALYCVPVTKSELHNMQVRLDFFAKNQSKFTYDFVGLIANFFHISYNPEFSFFCSRFVADILHVGKPDEEYVKDPSMVRPMDLTEMPFAHYVTGGIIDDYNEKRVKQVTKRILKEEELRRKSLKESAVYCLPYGNPYLIPILQFQLSGMNETAFDDFKRMLTSFKIRFKPDGSVVISRREYNNLNQHFKNSHKMIQAYQKAGNAEGMKSELARIYYMSEIISKYYLHNTSADKDVVKDMADLRSVMINVIHYTVKEITKLEPDFNFQEYYASTKYSSDIEIPKTAVQAIGKSILTAI